jgi:hypothetical protein
MLGRLAHDLTALRAASSQELPHGLRVQTTDFASAGFTSALGRM